MDDNLDQVREFMRANNTSFICPQCGGTFFGTRMLNTPQERGYCNTDNCHFEWLRVDDGEHFYVTVSVNEVLGQQR